MARGGLNFIKETSENFWSKREVKRKIFFQSNEQACNYCWELLPWIPDECCLGEDFFFVEKFLIFIFIYFLSIHWNVLTTDYHSSNTHQVLFSLHALFSFQIQYKIINHVSGVHVYATHRSQPFSKLYLYLFLLYLRSCGCNTTFWHIFNVWLFVYISGIFNPHIF